MLCCMVQVCPQSPRPTRSRRPILWHTDNVTHIMRLWPHFHSDLAGVQDAPRMTRHSLFPWSLSHPIQQICTNVCEILRNDITKSMTTICSSCGDLLWSHLEIRLDPSCTVHSRERKTGVTIQNVLRVGGTVSSCWRTQSLPWALCVWFDGSHLLVTLCSFSIFVHKTQLVLHSQA